MAPNVFLLLHSAIEAQKNKTSFYAYGTDFKQNNQHQRFAECKECFYIAQYLYIYINAYCNIYLKSATKFPTILYIDLKPLSRYSHSKTSFLHQIGHNLRSI